MDDGKSGNAKRDRNIRRDPKVVERGVPAPASRGGENKAELPVRLKAAAKAKKA